MLARITYVIDRASAQVLRFAQDDNTYLIAISIAESRLYRQGIHECIDRYTRFFPKWSTEGSRRRFCVASPPFDPDTGR